MRFSNPISTEFKELTIDVEAGTILSDSKIIFMEKLTEFVNCSLVSMMRELRSKFIVADQKAFKKAAYDLKNTAAQAGCKRAEAMSRALYYCAEQFKYDTAIQIFNMLSDETIAIKQEFEKISPESAVSKDMTIIPCDIPKITPEEAAVLAAAQKSEEDKKAAKKESKKEAKKEIKKEIKKTEVKKEEDRNESSEEKGNKASIDPDTTNLIKKDDGPHVLQKEKEAKVPPPEGKKMSLLAKLRLEEDLAPAKVEKPKIEKPDENPVSQPPSAEPSFVLRRNKNRQGGLPAKEVPHAPSHAEEKKIPEEVKKSPEIEPKEEKPVNSEPSFAIKRNKPRAGPPAAKGEKPIPVKENKENNPIEKPIVADREPFQDPQPAEEVERIDETNDFPFDDGWKCFVL